MSSTADSAGARSRTLRVLCGPTAAGKSALAMRLAERVTAAIISADSRQVYRGFDLGTAKPAPDERARVPHFGVDVADPHERYSASDWAAAVPSWIAAARAGGREPLVVGGTGFYLRALFAPLFEAPPLDPARRRALETWLSERSTADLQRWCRALDPARAALGRTQLLRAIETALLTGQRISELHATRGRAPAGEGVPSAGEEGIDFLPELFDRALADQRARLRRVPHRQHRRRERPGPLRVERADDGERAGTAGL